MGLDWDYSGPDEVYDELSECMDSMKNITWERLVKDGAVTYPCDDEDKPGNEVIFGEGPLQRSLHFLVYLHHHKDKLQLHL